MQVLIDDSPPIHLKPGVTRVSMTGLAEGVHEVHVQLSSDGTHIQPSFLFVYAPLLIREPINPQDIMIDCAYAMMFKRRAEMLTEAIRTMAERHGG